jgi:hypothetical protein
MPRFLTAAAIAAGLALPLLAAPVAANASCGERVATGTVLGGVGGALIGNSIARGGGGAIVGGLGGAVAGHEIARSGCHYEHRRAYYDRRRYGPYRPDAAGQPGGPPPGAPAVYYDQYGNPIALPPGPPPG